MTNNTDRLPDIKARQQRENNESPWEKVACLEGRYISANHDRAWLIAELEQTRTRCERLEELVETVAAHSNGQLSTGQMATKEWLRKREALANLEASDDE